MNPTQSLTQSEKKIYEAFLMQCKQVKEATAITEVESPTDKVKRINRFKCEENFEEAIAYYFPHYCSAPFGWFHRKAWKDIFLYEKRINIWEWSRESAKSVFADVFIPIYMLITDQLDGMILASENEGKAKILLKDIEAELTINTRLLADFGDFGVIGSFQQGYFSTKKGIGFWAFGLGQNPAGVRQGHRRPNYGVVDDADNKDVAKNQERTQERIDWIRGEFMGCLSTKKRTFVFANNRVARNGLTAHMVGDVDEDDPINDDINHIKVFFTEDPITHEMLKIEDGGVPAWRENFTIEEAKGKIADMKDNADRQLYHRDIPKGKTFKRALTTWVQPLPIHEYDHLIAYNDPSFSGSKKADTKAIVLMGRKGKYIDVLWAWVRKAELMNMIQSYCYLDECIRELQLDIIYGKSQPKLKGVNYRAYSEGNFAQKLILKKEFINYEESMFIPIFDMRSKPDKTGRIEVLSSPFNFGLLRFNENLRKDKDMQTLLNQFYQFPAGHDDGPDAVEGAYYYLQKKKPKGDGKTKKRYGKIKKSKGR